MTTPKEKPILFSGPMVRAILEGRKTQTRRVMNPQPIDRPSFVDYGRISVVKEAHTGQTWTYEQCVKSMHRFCPYGPPGTLLWVRETWQTAAAMNVCHVADDYYLYSATDPDWETTEGWKWRPSIYMPREAARLFLEVKAVRVERVQDISEADALAEGMTFDAFLKNEATGIDPVHSFKILWDSLNAKRGHGWASNPWVWVIEFERVEA